MRGSVIRNAGNASLTQTPRVVLQNRIEELQSRLMEYEAASSRVWQTLKAVFPLNSSVKVSGENVLVGTVKSYVADAPDRLLIEFAHGQSDVVFLSRVRPIA